MYKLNLNKEQKRAVNVVVKNQNKLKSSLKNRIIIDDGRLYITDVHRVATFNLLVGEPIPNGEYALDGNVAEAVKAEQYPNIDVIKNLFSMTDCYKVESSLSGAIHAFRNVYNSAYIHDISKNGLEPVTGFYTMEERTPSAIECKGVTWLLMPIRDSVKIEEVGAANLI